jgi:hypothetical protein
MRRLVPAIAALLACGDRRAEQAPPPPPGDAAAAPVGDVGAAGADTEPDDVGVAPVGSTDPVDLAEPPPEVGVDQLGAIPAWRAVVDRAQLLARRGDGGVVYGQIGGAVAATPLTWLIDETEGDGALAIRVDFGPSVPPEGSRVAVRGAWKVDDARRWYWAAAAVTPLPRHDAPAAAPAHPPGHVIADAPAPGGWAKVRDPSRARDGDLCAFTVVEVPVRDGDGWGASDRKWGTLMAYVQLPGEHVSYGGHDLRTADERWSLKKGWTYWVRVAKVRRRDGQIPVIEAASPPVRWP